MTASAIYLHIGAPKTGTSFLQRMIWLNKEELRAQGFFFPPGSRRMQFDAVSDLRGGIWSENQLSATWDLVVERAHLNEGVAVVSEELLCGSPPEVIERIVTSLAPIPVHVVHAARDFARQVPAEWQQWLRSRSTTTYELYLDRLRDVPDQSFWQTQDPTKAYARWAPFLEPGHFHVLTVPPPGADPKLLWQRFCSIVGFDPDVPHAPPGMQNPSLGLAEAELLRRFNVAIGDRFPMRDRYIRVVRDNLMRDALFTAPEPQRIGVPAPYVEWVRERSQQMVDDLSALAAAGEVDVVGSPEELAANVVDAVRLPSELSDGELLDAAIAAWIRQHEVIEQRMDERDARRAERESAPPAPPASFPRRVRGALARRLRG